MRFTFEMEIGNAATLVVGDVAQALSKTASKICQGHGFYTVVLSLAGCTGKVMDINGNTVGHWAVKED